MSDDKGPPDIIVGSGVWLRATTYDLGQSPPELFDPGDGVDYYLMDPLDTVRVNGLAMDNVGTGQYQAWYQTEDDDPLGRWLWAVAVGQRAAGRKNSGDGGVHHQGGRVRMSTPRKSLAYLVVHKPRNEDDERVVIDWLRDVLEELEEGPFRGPPSQKGLWILDSRTAAEC